MEPLVGAIDGAAVARARVAAIQHVLHGKVDVDALALACDLDAIAESGDGAMRPARAAVCTWREGKQRTVICRRARTQSRGLQHRRGVAGEQALAVQVSFWVWDPSMLHCGMCWLRDIVHRP